MKPRDILYIVLIVILIVFSGRFSAIDRAYSSVRITRLEKDETIGTGDGKHWQLCKVYDTSYYPAHLW